MLGRPAALAALIAAAAAVPASAAIPSGNLLQNPGAEEGTAGWTPVGSWEPVAYGTPGTLGSAQQPQDAGGSFFAGGDGPDQLARGFQTLDVSQAADEIDACHVSATASGYFGGLEAQADTAGADVAFLSADGEALDVFQTGYPTPSDRGGASGFLSYTGTHLLPIGTRSIRFTVTAQRAEGSYNDGYADNLSLSLAETERPSPPVPVPRSGLTVVLNVVRGRVTLDYTITIFVPGGGCALTEDDVQRILDAVAVLLAGKPVVDATHGVVELKAAGSQTAQLSQGAFQIRQRAAARPLTELTMRGGDFSRCRDREGAAAKRTVVRRLFGQGHGRFRTRGRHSSATIRGTSWVVKDTCAGTLTLARRGTVVVRDLEKHRTRVLHSGESYLAAAR